jgi:hypothetical protein
MKHGITERKVDVKYHNSFSKKTQNSELCADFGIFLAHSQSDQKKLARDKPGRAFQKWPLKPLEK